MQNSHTPNYSTFSFPLSAFCDTLAMLPESEDT